MNIIEILPEEFYGCCPVAQNPDDTVFSMIAPFLEAPLKDMLDFVKGVDLDENPEIAGLIKKFASCSGFAKAIPQLDLVLTPTGFGVVNNDQVSPASKERVLALRSELEEMAVDALDDIADRLTAFPEWSAGSEARSYFCCCFTKREVAEICNVPVTLANIKSRLPDVIAAEEAMAAEVSPELLAHLREAIRTASHTFAEFRFLKLLKAAVSQFVKHEDPFVWRSLINAAVKYLEENLSDFPSYSESQVYKARHYKPYENKKDDSCFFFG